MYGLEHKLLGIAASCVILVVLAMARAHTRTFFSPACIFAASWFAFTFFPLTLLFSTPVNALAILYIASSVLVFFLSSLPFDWKAARKRNLRKGFGAISFSTPLIVITLYLSAVLSALLSLAILVRNGFSLNQVFLELLATSGQFAAQRGSEQTEYGALGVLSTFFTYLSPALGGLQASGKRRGYFFAISILPCMLAMLTQSSKIVFLVGVCLYISTAFLARIYAHDLAAPRIRLTPKVLLGILMIPIAVLVSFVSRLGVTGLEELSAAFDALIFSLNSYTVAQVYAFSDFFSFTINAQAASVYKNDYQSFGAFTFASIFDMLGIGKEFPPGMYSETAWHGSTFETNIFTFFRGLIYDFGVFGSLFFLFIFGLASHFVTHRVLSRQRAWFSCSAYIAIIVFILMGYLFSVFVARYLFLNAAAIFVILLANDWKGVLTKPRQTQRCDGQIAAPR